MPNKTIHWLLGFIAFVLLVRLVTLGAYPLMDTTESRYAEIGRIMFETGDWITPYFDYNIPFWGKPPLSFWVSASSFNLFGVNEFAARLPSWILGVSCLLVLKLAAKPLGIANSLLPSALLASSIVFFLSMGAVMTEASLVLGITLSMVSGIYVLASDKADKHWPILFFIGLAIGMLAKGPIALVFIGVPLCFWAVVHGQIKVVWEKFHWVKGTLVFIVISMPWYVLAELKTPGFINYFIIGEHFNRFLVSGWKGDLYGSAHDKPYGTIWLYWLQSSFPWGIIALGYLTKILIVDFKTKTKRFKLDKIDWLLIYWALFPEVFFTLAGNILWTYVLPGLPAFMLFIVRKMEQVYFSDSKIEQTQQALPRSKQVTALKYIAFLTPMIFIIFIVTINFKPSSQIKSEKSLINPIAIANPNIPIYYLDRLQFSARFYSYGNAKEIKIKNTDKLIGKQVYLIIPKKIEKRKSKHVDEIKEKLYLVKIGENKRHVLYKAN